MDMAAAVRAARREIEEKQAKVDYQAGHTFATNWTLANEREPEYPAYIDRLIAYADGDEWAMTKLWPDSDTLQKLASDLLGVPAPFVGEFVGHVMQRPEFLPGFFDGIRAARERFELITSR